MTAPTGRPLARGGSLLAGTRDVTNKATAMVAGKTNRRAGGLRRRALAVVGVLMMAVFVSGLVHAGGRYFYCEALGLSLSDPCVGPPSADRPACPSAALQSSHCDCCEILVVQAMPSGAQSARASVPATPLLAILAAVPLTATGPGHDANFHAPGQRRSHPPWRPPASEARARLMVFLT
jgi:hypothetical protein